MRYVWWRITRPAVRMWRRIQILFSRSYTALHTGNRSKRRGFLRAFGEQRFCTLPLVNGTIPYTHGDLSLLTIRCAWCGKPIFIGDYVTVSKHTDPAYEPPDGSLAYPPDPSYLIGCTADTCCDTIADAQGQWIPDDERPGHGKVEHIMSVYEAFAANPDATHATVTLDKRGRSIRIFDCLD